MFGFIIGLAFLVFLLWIGFKLTGTLLVALIWLCIRLPLALISFIAGAVCCCTLILIPVGIILFKIGLRFMVPGCLV